MRLHGITSPQFFPVQAVEQSRAFHPSFVMEERLMFSRILHPSRQKKEESRAKKHQQCKTSETFDRQYVNQDVWPRVLLVKLSATTQPGRLFIFAATADCKTEEVIHARERCHFGVLTGGTPIHRRKIPVARRIHSRRCAYPSLIYGRISRIWDRSMHISLLNSSSGQDAVALFRIPPPPIKQQKLDLQQYI